MGGNLSLAAEVASSLVKGLVLIISVLGEESESSA